ncbi:MAG: hypothetical protein SGPRY_008798, partial [Prymnesium sp.]
VDAMQGVLQSWSIDSHDLGERLGPRASQLLHAINLVANLTIESGESLCLAGMRPPCVASSRPSTASAEDPAHARLQLRRMRVSSLTPADSLPHAIRRAHVDTIQLRPARAPCSNGEVSYTLHWRTCTTYRWRRFAV